MRSHLVAGFILIAITRPSTAVDSLSPIERSLTEQYSSIHTLEVKFRVGLFMLDGERAVATSASDNAEKWEWAMSGSKRLVAMEARHYRTGEKFNRIWRSFDGQRGYDVLFWQYDPSRADTISVTPSIHRAYHSEARPGIYYGMMLSQQEGYLLEWLRRRTPETVSDLGMQDLNGHSCRKVKFARANLGTETDLNEATVWFDPSVDWLPRRIEIHPKRMIELFHQMSVGQIPKSPAPEFRPATGELEITLQVGEYQQVDDPMLGRPRWFPRNSTPTEGRVTINGQAVREKEQAKGLMVIDSVVVNGEIDDSRFLPEKSPGTLIQDMSQQPPVIAVVGGSDGTTIRIQMSEGQSLDADRARAQGRSAVPRVTTAPTTVVAKNPAQQPNARRAPAHWAWWGAFSFIVLAVAVFVRIRVAS